MHILSFIVQKQSRRSVPMSGFYSECGWLHGRMHRINKIQLKLLYDELEDVLGSSPPLSLLWSSFLYGDSSDRVSEFSIAAVLVRSTGEPSAHFYQHSLLLSALSSTFPPCISSLFPLCFLCVSSVFHGGKPGPAPTQRLSESLDLLLRQNSSLIFRCRSIEFNHFCSLHVVSRRKKSTLASKDGPSICIKIEFGSFFSVWQQLLLNTQEICVSGKIVKVEFLFNREPPENPHQDWEDFTFSRVICLSDNS